MGNERNTPKDTPKDDKQNNISAISMLKEAISGFEKAVNNLADEEATTDGKREKLLGRLEGVSKKHLTKSEAIQQGFAKTLSGVFDYAIKQFTSASDRIISNYNQSLTDITVRQQWSNKEYTKALNDATNWIKKGGLKTQFSEIDFTKYYQEALSTGMRDISKEMFGSDTYQELATNMAKQNMITNKLLPQLTLNSRTYARASKMLGESLTQNVTAIGKYTEQMYGAEGLDDGQIDNFMNSMLTKMAGGLAEQGLSPEQISEEIANAYGVYQQYSAMLGAEGSEAIMSDLRDLMSGNWSGANVMAQEAAHNAGIDFGSGNITAQQFASYFENYMANTLRYGKGIGSGMMASTGYGQEAVYDAAKLMQYLGPSGYQDFLSQTHNLSDMYKQYAEDPLKDGYYQSMDAKQEKWNENTVAKISNTVAEHIPSGVLGLISDTISTWFKTWQAYMAGQALLGGKGGGIEGSLLSKGGKLLASTKFGSSMGMQTTEAALNGGLLSKSGLSAALKAGGIGSEAGLGATGALLGTGLLLGGVVMGGADAIKAGKRAKESGMSTGEQIGQGARAFFTGSNTAGMSMEDKAAYYEQNGYFSAGNLFKNMGKGALIGGGIGTFAGGPVGTAIGAGIGAVVGGITNTIDQIADAHDFKKFNKAMEAATESTNKMAEANQAYEQTQEKTSSALESIHTLLDANGHVTAETTSALSNLKNLYPEYAKRLGDVDNLDQDYLKTLEKKIEREEYLNELNKFNGQDPYTATDWAKEAGVKSYGKGVEDFVYDYNNNAIGDDVTAYANENYQTYGYKSGHEYLQALKKAGVVRTYQTQTVDKFGNAQSVMAYEAASPTKMGNVQNELKQGSDAYNAELAGINQDYTAIIESYNNSKDGVTEQEKAAAENNVKAYLPGLIDRLQNMQALAPKVGMEEQWKTIDGEMFYTDELKSAYKLVYGDNADLPKFYRFGNDNIPYDQLSFIHRGEAVLTATVAEKLRSLAGSATLSKFITDLYDSQQGESSASASPESTNVSMDPIVDAIKTQTIELQNSLSEIAVLVSRILEPGTSATFNKNLVTYQGV